MTTPAHDTQPSEVTDKIDSMNHISSVSSVVQDENFLPPIVQVDSYINEEHIDLGWRSWLVVFVTCFAFVSNFFISPVIMFSQMTDNSE
jgi:hypothetical protein